MDTPVVARATDLLVRFAALALLLSFARAEAGPADPNAQAVTPGAGRDMVRLYPHGDERHSFLATAQGTPVIRVDGTDLAGSRYEFARFKSGGGLEPTGVPLWKREELTGALRELGPYNDRLLQQLYKSRHALRTELKSANDNVEPGDMKGAPLGGGLPGATPPERRGHENEQDAVHRVVHLVVPACFSDHGDRTLPSTSRLHEFFNSPTPGECCPTGSVRSYFAACTWGKLELTSVIAPWVRLAKREVDYATGPGGKDTGARRLAADALEALKGDPQSNFDWKAFIEKLNGVKKLAYVTVLHSGYGAEFLKPDIHGRASADRVWAQKVKVTWQFDPSLTVTQCAIASAFFGVAGTELLRLGMVCHEIAHLFGARDLYAGGRRAISGCGSFCLMANCWGADKSQLSPPMLCAFSLTLMRFLDPHEVKQGKGGNFELQLLSERTPNGAHRAIKVLAGFEAPTPTGRIDEYVLISFRDPSGFDARVKRAPSRQAGLAVWHFKRGLANESVCPKRVKNQCHPTPNLMFGLLQADGKYHLDLGESDEGWDQGDLHMPASNSALGRRPTDCPNLRPFDKKGTADAAGHAITDIQRSGSNLTFTLHLRE